MIQPTDKSSFTLRPAQAADETFLFNLRKATMTEHMQRAGEPVDDAEHRTRLLRRYEDAQVVCIHGEPAGLLKAYRTDTEWMVAQFQIAPAHQGQGIGEQVLRTILSAAQADGLPVSLKVLKNNPARRLYERVGFETVDEDELQFLMRRAAQ
jgi:ribosomal protein S18 acetylase RimI-like enzyme